MPCRQMVCLNIRNSPTARLMICTCTFVRRRGRKTSGLEQPAAESVRRNQFGGLNEGRETMIAMIACAKRKAGMSLAEFNQYWIEEHAPLVRSVPEFMRHVRKYVQFHCDPQGPAGGSPFGGSVDYDGVG